MTDLVPADEIEAIVGIKRHQSQHYARAVSTEQKVYVLHSRGCLDDVDSIDPEMRRDLRDCPFSLALDNGINVGHWTEDVPMKVTVGLAGGEWYLYPLEPA